MPNYQDLAHACQNYDLTAFESALQQIPNINAQDTEGRTALSHVLLPDILSRDVYTQHTQMDDAVRWALVGKKNSFLTSAVTTLLDKGASCSDQPNLLFHIALAENLCEDTKKSLLVKLLQAGADINAIGQGLSSSECIDFTGKTVIMAVLEYFQYYKKFHHLSIYADRIEKLLDFLIQRDGIVLPENLLLICIENEIKLEFLEKLSSESPLRSPENLAHVMTALINNVQQNPSSELQSAFTFYSFFVTTLRYLCKVGAQLPEEKKTWLFHQAYHYRVDDLIGLLNDDIASLVNTKDPDNNYTAIDHVLFGPESRKLDCLGPSGCKLLTGLLNHGADLDIIAEPNKRNILQYVIKSSADWPTEGFALLQTILSKGILDINIEDDKGITPFAAAARQYHPRVEIVGALLAEPSLKLDPQSCTYWMRHLIGKHWLPVSAAVETRPIYAGSDHVHAGNPKVLPIWQRLIALGAQINEPNDQGLSLLHELSTKNPPLFDFFLQQKNIHIPGDLLHHIISSTDFRKSTSDILFSLLHNVENIVRVLAKNPLWICQICDGEMPLGVAINQLHKSGPYIGPNQPRNTHHSNFEVVSTLLLADTIIPKFIPENEKNTSLLASLIPLTVTHINKRGETTLHQAIRQNIDTQLERELIATLIDKGADLNIQDSDKRIPLYYWCVQANAEGERYRSSLENGVYWCVQANAEGACYRSSLENRVHTFNLLKSWQNIPCYLSLVWSKMTWGTKEHKKSQSNPLRSLNAECIDHLLSYLSIKDFLAVMRGTELAVADRLTQRAKQASQLVPKATSSQQAGQIDTRSDTEATIGIAPR